MTAEGDPLPLVPLRIPRLDQGVRHQPDHGIQWMRDTKLSLFVHWGVYSVPAQGEWHMFDSKTGPTDYRAQYAGTFAAQAQSFDPAVTQGNGPARR